MSSIRVEFFPKDWVNDDVSIKTVLQIGGNQQWLPRISSVILAGLFEILRKNGFIGFK